jgi:hypothetical protein
MPLSWDKPARAEPVAAWKERGFEDGPAGGYVPNMAEEDLVRWKAKVVGRNTAHPQVEIRKSFGGVQMTLVVSLGQGYNYKTYKAVREPGHWGANTQGFNVHLALNGGAQMTFADMQELHDGIAEARRVLEALPAR